MTEKDLSKKGLRAASSDHLTRAATPKNFSSHRVTFIIREPSYGPPSTQSALLTNFQLVFNFLSDR